MTDNYSPKRVKERFTRRGLPLEVGPSTEGVLVPEAVFPPHILQCSFFLQSKNIGLESSL